MLRLLADENLNGDILRGLRLRKPEADVVRVRDVGLEGAEDPAVLAWAGESDRIVLTHDRATLPHHAHDRVRAGKPMPGVFVVNARFPIGHAIEDLLLLIECSEQPEWRGRVLYLPL